MRAKLITAFAAAVLTALATALSAGAAVTIGQLAPSSVTSEPTGDTTQTCGPSSGSVTQPTVTSGRSYVVPATGRITSWSTITTTTTDQQMALKIFRPLGGATYQTVTHDGPRPLTPSAVNTFSVELPVKPGDILGLTTTGTFNLVGCAFSVPGETYWTSFPEEPDDGESATFTSVPDYRLNVTAQVEPTNTFTFGGTTRNKKKGTATITATVPNPGELTATGKGVKASGAAVTSKAVGAGAAKLTIRAKGKKKAKLNDTGKVKLNATISYTPTGGSPGTQSTKVKLKKKL